MSVFMPMALVEQWSSTPLLPKIAQILVVMTGWVFWTAVLLIAGAVVFVVKGSFQNRQPIVELQREDVFYIFGGMIVLNFVFTAIFFTLSYYA